MTFKNRNDQYNAQLFSQRFVLYIDFFIILSALRLCSFE